MSGGEKLIKKVKRKTLFAYLKTGIKLPFFLMLYVLFQTKMCLKWFLLKFKKAYLISNLYNNIFLLDFMGRKIYNYLVDLCKLRILE